MIKSLIFFLSENIPHQFSIEIKRLSFKFVEEFYFIPTAYAYIYGIKKFLMLDIFFYKKNDKCIFPLMYKTKELSIKSNENLLQIPV